MFALEVRDHIMIAHSFTGSFFGPAQATHGATFVVDACFFANDLDDNGVVVDIGAAHRELKAVLDPINYKNLDSLEQFDGVNTTTEFLCKHIWDALAVSARSGALGREPGGIQAIRVKLSESHVARAWYEAKL